MVTSKQLPSGTVMVRPRRRGLGGAGLVAFLVVALSCALALAGFGLFAPASLAVAQEHALALLHGGIAAASEQTYVDGCVAVNGSDAPQAITRTHRTTLFNDGTTLEVVFSGKPADTNACP
jgi:hypothetical protein